MRNLYTVFGAFIALAGVFADARDASTRLERRQNATGRKFLYKHHTPALKHIRLSCR